MKILGPDPWIKANNFAWLILFLPLFGGAGRSPSFTRNNARAQRCRPPSPRCSVAFPVRAVLLCFFRSTAVDLMSDIRTIGALSIGDLQTPAALHMDIGLRLDRLNLPMLLVVTGVGGLIHHLFRRAT